MTQEIYKKLKELKLDGTTGWDIVKSEARNSYSSDPEKILEIPVIYKLIENGQEVGEEDFKLLTDPILKYAFPKTRKIPVYSKGENPAIVAFNEMEVYPSEMEFEFFADIKNLIKNFNNK